MILKKEPIIYDYVTIDIVNILTETLPCQGRLKKHYYKNHSPSHVFTGKQY